MRIDYSFNFRLQYKKADVRIRNSVDEKIEIFLKNSLDPILNNHSLREPLKGLRSIDITADWRAIYEEIYEGDESIIYFIGLGTHKQLYEK